MKSALLLTSMALFTLNTAHADGFRCEGLSSGLKATLYNHTESSAGTRKPSVFMISNPRASKPHRTLIAFTSEARNLEYKGYGRYVGTVGALNPLSEDPIIGGASLQQIKTVTLDLDFSYAHDAVVLANTLGKIHGTLVYQTKAGYRLDEKVSCLRYHKEISVE
ncbi:MAG: hypothetical protein H7333_11195 [Bdellovibrionales bacterium]|nr:hypothetical protein [Oligoflexia bacterium]